jgi:hypothetical protein
MNSAEKYDGWVVMFLRKIADAADAAMTRGEGQTLLLYLKYVRTQVYEPSQH